MPMVEVQRYACFLFFGEARSNAVQMRPALLLALQISEETGSDVTTQEDVTK